ncbi:hypothetical protein KY327_01990 [Candidatus Woesearchaeota archaeon]|nr:hypothetical protein [Candidatus Woesearchaeota archaeon]
MTPSALLAANRFLIETLYVALILIPALYVFARTWKLYRFSGRQSVKWFSLSFLLFATAFLTRYVSLITLFNQGQSQVSTIQAVNLPLFLMELTIALPGFLLVYSLTRKHLKGIKPWHLLIAAVATALLDLWLQSFILLYATQIALFAFGTTAAWQRHKRKKTSHRRTLAITMSVLLAVWIVNAIGQGAIDEYAWLRLPVYLLTAGGMWLFLIITDGLLKKR